MADNNSNNSNNSALKQKIKSLLEDGKSDAEILRLILRIWPKVTFTGLKKMINTILDEEAAAEMAAPADANAVATAAIVSTQTKTETVRDVRHAMIYFDHTDNETDIDRLTVLPLDDGVFGVEMAYNLTKHQKVPKNANHFEGNKDVMHAYLSDILDMVAADELPYKKIEFAIPFFPTICLKPATLQNALQRNMVLNAFNQFLEHFEKY